MMIQPALPNIEWKPLRSCSSRYGKTPTLIVLHTWGSKPGSTCDGVWNYQSDPANQVSSHYIYGGTLVGPSKDILIQAVPLAQKAWTNCGFNPVTVTIECNDTIFNYGGPIPKDSFGMEVAARIVAWHLHHYQLPPKWIHGKNLLNGGKGFTRHADLGDAGCGHLFCPTTHMLRWWRFVYLVKREYKRADFRPDFQPH